MNKQTTQTAKAKPTQKINTNKPVYELQLHNTTLEVSNSIQYIMNLLPKITTTTNKHTVYKIEFGFKTVFFQA